jgi:Fe/S biogenesis protein NfuA
MISITKKAQEYFFELLKSQAPNTRIRVFVSNPGTPGVECGILYCPEDMVTGADDFFKYDNFEVAIDKSSQPYLIDAIIDFKEDENNQGSLTFKAPKLKRQDIPESASLFEKLDSFFRTTINPSLASHGGFAQLISASEDGIIEVKFGGGCRGCSMVNVTLKEGIEANLRSAFPGMIKEVIDITDHQISEETYSKE